MQGAFNFWVMFVLKWPDAIGQKLVCLETDPRGLLELLFLVFTWRYLLNFFKASNMTR